MQDLTELAWRLRVAVCSITVFLGLIYIIVINMLLLKRLRALSVGPVFVHDIALIFGISQLVHASVVVVTIIVLFVVAQLTTLDLGNLTSALGVYSTQLWVSWGA